jgi:hypothetical protein
MDGSSMTKPKMTPAIRAALISDQRYGNPTAHLRGQSAWGGWQATRAAMYRRGWLDKESKVTDAGRAALAETIPL